MSCVDAVKTAVWTDSVWYIIWCLPHKQFEFSGENANVYLHVVFLCNVEKAHTCIWEPDEGSAAVCGAAQSPASESDSRHWSVCCFLPQRASTVQVRALYDFTAEEEDELGFCAGDVIEVLDRSDPSWWKGKLRGKSGLFPANYTIQLWGKHLSRCLHRLNLQMHRLLMFLQEWKPCRLFIWTAEDCITAFIRALPESSGLTERLFTEEHRRTCRNLLHRNCCRIVFHQLYCVSRYLFAECLLARLLMTLQRSTLSVLLESQFLLLKSHWRVTSLQLSDLGIK